MYALAASAAAACVMALLSVQPVQAQTYKLLYTFAGTPDGVAPLSDLKIDAEGNLYGTTSQGGTGVCHCGTVFELKRTKDGWKEELLYSFGDGSDGAFPIAGVTFGSDGSLYGATSSGGNNIGYGTIFKLTRSSKGWTEQVLYRFTGGPDSQAPNSDLVFDRLGKLYGTTSGGRGAYGTVFELSPQSNGSWVETTLHAFTGAPDGAVPAATLVLDGQGDIYGLTTGGGAGGCHRAFPLGCGALYELTPNPSGWTETILYSFVRGGGFGVLPSGGLTLDKAGNLYGTTQGGGDTFGVVFKLARSQKHGWQESVLYRFYGGVRYEPDGRQPVGRLVMNARGNLFGATNYGGSSEAGTLFEVKRPGNGRREKLLYQFAGGTDAASPRAGVIADSQGILYGTTQAGGGAGCGGNGCGTVYQLKP
jgi:uncharacterized repeat protein (TIGR03803 family)